VWPKEPTHRFILSVARSTNIPAMTVPLVAEQPMHKLSPGADHRPRLTARHSCNLPQQLCVRHVDCVRDPGRGHVQLLGRVSIEVRHVIIIVQGGT
jgi:hypothetical protein